MSEKQRIKELQRKQFQFLRQLYQMRHRDNPPMIQGVAETVGLKSDEDIRDVVSFLENEGLIEQPFAGGVIKITHQGIKTVQDFFTSIPLRRLLFMNHLYETVSGDPTLIINRLMVQLVKCA